MVWEGASSDYGRVTSAGGKYYIDWAIPVAELTSRGIGISTTKFFATSTNANNYNKDHLQCYDTFADLSIVKSDSPDPVTNGGTLTYTLTVNNGGPDTASSVIVNDTLPSGFAVTSVTPSAGSCSDVSAPTIRCELGNMANGANATVTIVGTITTAETSVTNTATVKLDETQSIDLNQANNSDSEDTAINPATGTIIVHKDVQGPNGEAITDTSSTFKVKLDGADEQNITDNGTVTYSNVLAGTHTITESVIPAGYSLYDITPDSDSGTAGAQISVTAGQTTDVYVVNRQQATTLTLVKVVTNDDGGNAVVADFPLFYDGNQATSGVITAVAPGTYTLSETNFSGYTPSVWVCTGTGAQNGSDITLTLGQSATCTITNDDTAPTLKLVKAVTNDNGGNGVADDWTLYATGDGGFDNLGGSGVAETVLANEDYVPSESTVAGYSASSWSCTDGDNDGTVNLNEGEDVVCTITNDDTAPTITLIKNVVGGSAGENDFGISIDDATVESNVATEVDANTPIVLDEEGLGGYTFTSIEGDEQCPTELGGTVTLNEGEDITCTITNTRDTGSITVNKVIDADGNLLDTPEDQTVGVDWEFDVIGTGEDTSDPAAASTGETGSVTFASLNTGQYSITETLQDGYDLIDVVCNVENGPTWIGNTVSEVPVSKDAETVCTFYNSPNGTIHGYKWNDQNEDGTSLLQEEPRLAGWTINLYESDGDGGYNPEPIDSMVTDDGSEHFGWYWFEHLLPGEYKVCEVLQDGWQQTYPDNEGEDCHFLSLPDDNSNGFPESEDVVSGPEYNFGNHFTPPTLQIAKTNDHDAPETSETPGNDVVYTITVTAPGEDEEGDGNQSNVEDVTVTDLPPAGFVYDSTVGISSSIGGGHIGTLALSSSYASPGVWSLGTMQPGEVITITYRAIISGGQDAGTYEDLAFARGNSIVNETTVPDVLANADEETPFVGTDVEVVLPVSPADVALTNIVDRNVDTKTITKTKRVLGAATVLPYTGANINTILLALMSLLGGLILLLLSKRSTWMLIRSLSKSMTKAFLFAVVAGSVLLAGHVANAASGDLNVQIEQPKAVINSAEFKVGFVVLDISADDPIDVECEVAYEAGSFGEFDTYTIAAGGTSGDCVVTAADIPTDGTYTFRVTAEEQEGDSDVATAAPIELVSGAPSTPLNYSRTSCTASFTTANDGLTDMVELYRSLSSTFTANASTFVDDIAILPNTAGAITDANGDCGGSYFYAIRAVAASGLTSGFVGDESVVIDNENEIKYKTKTTKVAGPTTVLGAIPVASETPPESAVEGAATVEEEAAAPSAAEAAGPGGSVLGAMTEALANFWSWIWEHPWWSALILLLLIVLTRYAYRKYQKRDEPGQA